MSGKKPQQPRPATPTPNPVAEHIQQRHEPIKSQVAELVKTETVGKVPPAAPSVSLMETVVTRERSQGAPNDDQPAVAAAGDTLVEEVKLPDTVDATVEGSEEEGGAFDADTEAAMARIGTHLQEVHRTENINYHAAGKELIDLVGPPTDRLPFGQRIMEVLSQRYETPLSTLYSARWFAYKFPDFEAFQRQHPDAVTFTRVRALLTEKKPGGQQDLQNERRLVDKAFNDLEQLCQQVPELGENMTKRQIRQLHALVAKLTEAVAAHLPIPVNPQFGTAESAVKPEGDAPAEAAPPD